MDYPESDDDCATRTDDLASGAAILNTEDMDLGSGSTLPDAGWTLGGNNRSASAPTPGTVGSGSMARQVMHSDGMVRRPTASLLGDNMAMDGPDLPPIYRTVKKDREKGLVTHTLSGSGPSRAGSTMYGASVSDRPHWEFC
jgi:hypothetical protein